MNVGSHFIFASSKISHFKIKKTYFFFIRFRRNKTGVMSAHIADQVIHGFCILLSLVEREDDLAL